MYRQAPSAVDWIDRAPGCFENELRCPQSPSVAFDIIVDPAHEAAWFPDFRRATWLTPAPHGVGSRRDYRLSYLRLLEHFTVWEPGVCLRFDVVSLSLPLTRRFTEDYAFTEEPDGGTHVRWRVAYEPNLVTRRLQPLLRPFFADTFRQATAQLEAYLRGLHDRSSPGTRPRT